MPAAALDLPSPCTVGDFIDAAEDAIRSSRHVELWKPWVARADAEELAEVVLQRDVAQEDLDVRLSAAQRDRLLALVGRRVAGEPMTLLRGYIDFHRLRLDLRPGVFSPRLSSEFTAVEAIRRLRRRRTSPVMVEVACGVGPVALAVGHAVRGAEVWALDISPEAVDLGRHNARKLGLDNVRFAAGDLLAPLPARLHDAVDVISSHPPYVAKRLLRTLPAEIARYEPVHTLTDNSDDGLHLVRRLAAESGLWLRRGGWLMIEIAPDMARSVAAILRQNSYTEVQSLRESARAVTRLVVGRQP